jgi:hypothetical protein
MQGHIRSLKKIGRGIGYLQLILHFPLCSSIKSLNSQKHSFSGQNQPAKTYILIPSYDFFETFYFGKPMVHTITGYGQISWRPIYNMYKPVALRALTSNRMARSFPHG